MTFMHPLNEKQCTLYPIVLFIESSEYVTAQANSCLLARNTVTPEVLYKLLLAEVQNAEKLPRHIPHSCCNLYKLISYCTKGIKIMIFTIITMMTMMT